MYVLLEIFDFKMISILPQLSWMRHVVCDFGLKSWMRHGVTHDTTFLCEVLLFKSSYDIYHMK